MENKRLKFIRITQKQLAEILMQGEQRYNIARNPLPEDATIVNAAYCAPCRAVDLVVWSSEYEIVPEGYPIPIGETPEINHILNQQKNDSENTQ